MNRPKDLLTVSEAADLKGAEPGTVRGRIARGQLRAVKVGPIWLIHRRDLEGWRVGKWEESKKKRKS